MIHEKQNQINFNWFRYGSMFRFIWSL